MKKALTIVLSLLLVFTSIPLSFIGSAADASNLAAEYTNANGDVTWSDNADPWGGNTNLDTLNRTVNGGLTWSFGLSGTGTSSPAYIYIKASNLAASTKYDFSYIYAMDYKILFDSVKDPSSVALNGVSSSDVVLSSGDRAHQVSFSFTTVAAGDYTITLKMAKGWNNSNCNWSGVTLSDLVLKKSATDNLAADYTYADGDVTWSDNAGAWDGDTNLDTLNRTVNGGLTWSFGISSTSTSSPAYIYIKASGLEADTEYDFSYIYAMDYKIIFDSIKSPSGVKIGATAKDSDLGKGDRAHQVAGGFWTEEAGDYTITLKMAKGWNNSNCNWSGVTLSDLVLIKKTPANLAESYTSAGGQVTWTENAGAWDGDTNIDTYNRTVNGGLTWTFGIPSTNTSDKVAYITIKAEGLEAETSYDFSYIYAMDYCIYFDSVIDPSGEPIDDIQSVDVPLNKGDRAHQVSFSFTTDDAGEYKIVLKMGKGWNNSNCNWSGVTLSDLVLNKKSDQNLALSYSNESGNVEWDTLAEAWEDQVDSREGLYGGYSWRFGVSRTGANNHASVTIHADDLEADSRYEFSYIYDQDFAIKLNGVLDQEGDPVSKVTTPVDTYTGVGKAHKVVFEFVTTFAGDYDIVLNVSKAWPVEPCGWSFSRLSDLCLIKKVNRSTDNLAEAWTHANGHVNWTENSESRAEDGSEGINGGYSWRFGIGSTNNTDASKIAYVTITTDALKANALYDFSYVYSKDFKILMDSIKMPSGSTVDMADMADEALTVGDRAHKMSTRFITEEAGVYTITLKMAKGWNNVNNSWDCALLSDLFLFEVGSDPISGKVSFGTGGTATCSENWYFAKGTKVEVVATPFAGNTFDGWYNAAGTKVSADAIYRFVANESFDLTAKFTGHNMASTDYLLLNGLDGTFENGDVGEWSFKPNAVGETVEWCSATRVPRNAHNGDYALQLYSRHRTSVLRFDDLETNKDYYLSFYAKLPYSPAAGKGIFAECTLENEGGTFYQVYRGTWENFIYDGSGWHRIDVHFNPGDYDYVTLSINWGINDWDTYLYLDDFTLAQYDAKATLENGSVNDKSGWAGDYTVTSDNKATLAAAGDRIQQAVKLEKQSSYTLTFKAKGKVEAGAARVDVFDPSPKDWITSQSVTETEGDWNDYSITFYSGVHGAAQIYFEALAADAQIDDVVLTKNDSRIGSVVEKVDFETERFALNNSDTNVWEIYEANGDDDANVYNGNKSLHFKFDKAEANTEYLLDEAYLSNEILQGGTYRLTAYVKMADGKDGGSIKFSPDYEGDFVGGESKMIYTPNADGWQKIEIIFTNTDKIMIKTVISNVVGVGATYCDFYIDDITLELIRPFVIDTDVETPYAALVHNVLENEGFEKNPSKNDWKDLPGATTSIRSGDADVQKKYLRVDSGTFYILPVQVKANAAYTLAASVRGKNTDGWIGVASSADGKVLYTTQDGKDLSKIDVNFKEWTRKGFTFNTEETGIVYLVLSCSEGYFDLDNVMLYESQYGLDWDPNVYNKAKPYDYEAIDSATCVINGGFGKQPHLLNKEEAEDTDLDGSPLTGDSLVYPIMLGVIALLAGAMVVLLLRKKHSAEGGNSK